MAGRHRQAKAACEEAKLNYQQTALTGFREVSDALISHRRFDEARAEQAEAVTAGRQAVASASDRDSKGNVSYHEVLEAKHCFLPKKAFANRGGGITGFTDITTRRNCG